MEKTLEPKILMYVGKNGKVGEVLEGISGGLLKLYAIQNIRQRKGFFLMFNKETNIAIWSYTNEAGGVELEDKQQKVEWEAR